MPTPPVLRRTAAGAAAALALLALPGCLSIKTEAASQRAPGVVTLGGVVCASDYDGSVHKLCHPAVVAEQDETRADAIAGLGQVLVGFRVPDGLGAPERFAVRGRAVTFERRAEYAAALRARFPAPAGQHWEGYISSPKDYAPAAGPHTLAIEPEFTLPAGPGGAPFAGPLRWRMVVGFRQLEDADDADAPADCEATTGATACVDSPPAAALPVDLVSPVSDLRVLAAPPATAPAGTTATVAFPVAYRDGGRLGAIGAGLAAATDAPGASAAPAAPSLRLAPGDRTIDVAVAVPAGTPPGTYGVTLSASAGTPAVTRSARGTLVVTAATAGSGAAAADADGDGLEGAADRCPAAPRGRFDRDADGCPGPYRRLRLATSATWGVGARGVELGTLRLKGLREGARVRLRGAVRQTLTASGRTLEVRRLRDVLLRRGEGFSARVTAPGFIGQELTLRVRRYGRTLAEFKRIALKPFRRTRRCIPAGAAAPARTCDATPPAGP